MRRDILSNEQFETLLRDAGVTSETMLELYRDNNNYFAVYAFELLKYYGHWNVQGIDGGRARWLAEKEPLTKEIPKYEKTAYTVAHVNSSLRSLHDDVFTDWSLFVQSTSLQE